MVQDIPEIKTITRQKIRGISVKFCHPWTLWTRVGLNSEKNGKKANRHRINLKPRWKIHGVQERRWDKKISTDLTVKREIKVAVRTPK